MGGGGGGVEVDVEAASSWDWLALAKVLLARRKGAGIADDVGTSTRRAGAAKARMRPAGRNIVQIGGGSRSVVLWPLGAAAARRAIVGVVGDVEEQANKRRSRAP